MHANMDPYSKDAKIAYKNYHDWLIPKKVVLSFFITGLILELIGIVLLLVGGGSQSSVYAVTGAVWLGLGVCLHMICFLLCCYAYCVVFSRDEAIQTMDSGSVDGVHVGLGPPIYAIVKKPAHSSLKSGDRLSESPTSDKHVRLNPDIQTLPYGDSAGHAYAPVAAPADNVTENPYSVVSVSQGQGMRIPPYPPQETIHPVHTLESAPPSCHTVSNQSKSDPSDDLYESVPVIIHSTEGSVSFTPRQPGEVLLREQLPPTPPPPARMIGFESLEQTVPQKPHPEPPTIYYTPPQMHKQVRYSPSRDIREEKYYSPEHSYSTSSIPPVRVVQYHSQQQETSSLPSIVVDYPYQYSTLSTVTSSSSEQTNTTAFPVNYGQESVRIRVTSEMDEPDGYAPSPLVHPSQRRPMTFDTSRSSSQSLYDNVQGGWKIVGEEHV